MEQPSTTSSASTASAEWVIGRSDSSTELKQTEITSHSCGKSNASSRPITPERAVLTKTSFSSSSTQRDSSSPPSSSSLSMNRVFSRVNFPVQNAANALTWERLVEEAEKMVERDEFLASVVTEKILKHNSFAEAIVESLALVFHTAIIPAEEWAKLFASVYQADVVYESSDMLSAEKMGLLDLGAVRERDPASGNLVNPFLFFKGYKSIQAHRIAHILWNRGRKDAARAIQSRCSEIFSVDIHPAARIGAGLMIDHGTGVVIGETCVIGTNCSFLHGVTLGSTGKNDGDRHPKLGNDILIGCNSTILGNICIGSNTKVGSGSIVLKSLPCCVTAVGNPARIVGRSKCSSAANNMDLALHNVQYCLDISQIMGQDGRPDRQFQRSPDEVFSSVDKSGRGTLSREEIATAMGLRFGICPPPAVLEALFIEADGERSGRVNREGYEEISRQLITFRPKKIEHVSLLQEWQVYVESASSVCKFLLAKARLETELEEGPWSSASRPPSPLPPTPLPLP